MTKLTIALDCDGVLFSCNDYVRDTAERVLGRKMPPPSEHQHFEFDKAMNLTEDEWWRVEQEILKSHATIEMDWLPGGHEFADELARSGHDIFFLTSHWRGCPQWVVGRERRLNAHFPGIDVVFAHNKMRCSFDYLIDDKIQNIEKAGAAGLLFDQPWNRSAKHLDGQRYNSYNELLNFLGVK